MDLSIINEAAELVRNKFNISFAITRVQVEAGPTAIATSGVICPSNQEPSLILELTVTDCHSFFTEDIDLKYIIDEEDLLDGSSVDKVIGGDMKNYSFKTRETLRLAFIIYNGIRYAIDGEQKKEYIDKGWYPRLVSIQRQGYKTKAAK